jgi:putative nucleotidyltransferase with HDIG domain
MHPDMIRVVPHAMPKPQRSAEERRTRFRQFLLESVLDLPHREFYERHVDPHLIPGGGELYLGRTTAEIIHTLMVSDPLTAGHAASVAELAETMARELGLGVNPALVRLSGLMHDVWKLNLRDLLNHPTLEELEHLGRFEIYDEFPYRKFIPHAHYRNELRNDANTFFGPEEKQKMYEHPVRGAIWLRSMGFPREVVYGALLHHAYYGFPLHAEPYPTMNLRVPPDPSTPRHVEWVPNHVRFQEIAKAFEYAQPTPMWTTTDEDTLFWLSQIIQFADHTASARERRLYKPSVPQEVLLRRYEKLTMAGRLDPRLLITYERLLFRNGRREPWMRHTIYIKCVDPKKQVYE